MAIEALFSDGDEVAIAIHSFGSINIVSLGFAVDDEQSTNFFASGCLQMEPGLDGKELCISLVAWNKNTKTSNEISKPRDIFHALGAEIWPDYCAAAAAVALVLLKLEAPDEIYIYCERFRDDSRLYDMHDAIAERIKELDYNLGRCSEYAGQAMWIGLKGIGLNDPNRSERGES